MNFYFGIDGGGTKSRIIVERDDKVIIESMVGNTTNPYAVGLDKACCNTRDLILSALDKAGYMKKDKVYGCKEWRFQLEAGR